MLNKIFLTGNLTRDPELSETAQGVAYCRFSIAVNRAYPEKDGSRVADFFNCLAWRATAESCGRYLKKGSKITVVGSVQTRTYEDKDGNKKQATEVVIQEVDFLSRSDTEQAEKPAQATQKTFPDRKPTLIPIDDDEDLPF